MMKPVMKLRKGETVKNKYRLDDSKLRQWRYAAECASLGGGLMPGSLLSVVAIGTSNRVHWWVKLDLPGRYPAASIKVSGEELAMNFDLV